MHNNKIGQPFLIVFASFVILIVLSFFNTGNILGFQIKPIALFSDIINESLITDSLNQDTASIVKIDTVVRDLSAIVDYKHDSALLGFFNSLQKTKAGRHQTRIAYFGDSFIEGDLITQDFRSLLQNEFGGGGVGYVPITSIVAGFRQSVLHTFGEWNTYSLVADPPKDHNLFISGYTFCPMTTDSLDSVPNQETNWVKYSGVKQPRLNSFNTVRLFYGNSQGNNYATINGVGYQLNSGGIFNELLLQSDKGFQGVNAVFNCKSAIDIYGMSLESDTGVIVDNFSFRGNSGLPMSKVSRPMYRHSDSLLHYDLIIVEYGLNAISEKAKEYKWYESGFLATIRYLKTCYPNTDILIIGIGDKAIRANGKYIEDPAVQQILTLQQNVALTEGCAFWSLFNAMGGEGSMIAWADSIPALANKDYTHLNFRGARRAGELLHENLMKKYSAFLKNNTTP